VRLPAQESIDMHQRTLVHSSLALALATAALLSGCVENDEDIVVRPDGSLDVSMAAKGSPEDLTDGYPLPLEGPWRALDERTLSWIAAVGPDTGSAQSRERVRSGAWTEHEEGSQDTRLAVGAHFASAADLPRFVAPLREPYRTACLERQTSVAIEHKGAHDIYTFEREFGARRWSDWQVFDAVEDELSEDTRQHFSHNESLADDEWREVARIVRERYRSSAASFARDALSSVYTQGDATLQTGALRDALAAVDREVIARVDEHRLRAMYDAARAEGSDGLPPELNPDLLVRDTLRRALADALAASGATVATRNSVLARLEWDFTAFDQTGDIGDESFKVTVCMPGLAVDGNFDSSEPAVVDGVACTKVEWSFKGEALRDRATSLRVVSIVE
jgi:hypothetical protein